MRVAHVITRMILGGAQENTLYTCEDLIDRHRDDVLLVTGPAEGPEGSLMQRAADHGVPIALAPDMRRAIHPWRDAKSYFQVKKILKDFRPDVVHTHSAKGGMLGRQAAWALGVPAIVHTVHGAPFYAAQGGVGQAFVRWCEWYASRQSHALISVADAMTELMVSSRIAPREKFTTIYSGMEVEPFLAAPALRDRVRAELGFRPGDVVVGKIARLFHLKGHEFVIDAAKRVVAERPETHFLFVGDGILRDALERRIADAGLTGHFHFTGLVPPERIPALIAAMDLLVHTSLREGLARALPQALLVGRPAVSYDVDGAREVVINGETGFLIPAEAREPLENALLALVADPALRERLGAEGRRRCERVFRHEYMTERIREVYERVLAARRGR